MELSEEQKARAQGMADAVGDDPKQYFLDILNAAIKKCSDKVLELLVSGKTKLNERYPQISQQAEQAKIDIAVTKEAYRIWYEKCGANLVEREKLRLDNLFDRNVEKLEIFAEILKKAAIEIAELLKMK